jgi:hypothetical protein
MRVIVDAELTMSGKIDGRHYVQDPKCRIGATCFTFDRTGMKGRCRDFRKQLTGVKLCCRDGR